MTTKSPEFLARKADHARNYRPRHREKVSARESVRAALKSGRLVRPAQCARCGVECKPEASHDDYSKRLEVEWLCVPCHRVKDAVTHCKHGHEFTPENTRRAPDGRRVCRACARVAMRRHREAKQARAGRTE